MDPRGELVVAVQAATWEHDGQRVVVHPGTIVRRGNPAIRGREALFERLIIVADCEEPGLPPSLASVTICGAGGDPELVHGRDRVSVDRWRTAAPLLAG